MGEAHLTEVFLEALFEGKLPAERLVRRLLRHISSLCPTCHRELEAYAKKRRDAGDGPEINFDVLLHTVSRWAEKIEKLKKEAHRDLKELLRLAPAERYRRIDRALKRFRSPVLAELLLAKSQQAVFQDPEEAFHLADLAGKVTLCVNVRTFGIRVPEELLIRVKTFKANARRVAGRLAEASQWIRQPLEDLRNCPDPLVVGEVLTFAADILTAEQHFEHALSYLKEAVAIYEEIDHTEFANRSLILRSKTFRLMGDPDSALETIIEVLDRLPEEPVTLLSLSAHHSHALYLLEVGRKHDAREAFNRAKPLYEAFPEQVHQIRRRWLEGRIAESFEDFPEAEAAYREVQDGLVALGRGIDAALACMDRALLYVKRGEIALVKALAHDAHAVLSAHGIHREAIAALILFQEAAFTEQVEATLVHRLKAYLERSRNNPELIFEEQPE